MVLVLAAAIFGGWKFAGTKSPDAQAAKKGPGATPVVTARAESRDMPVRLKVNGAVAALQSVDLRGQITSTVRQVHIREGQNVRAGDLLFSLDARADEANIRKAEAQVAKDLADLATAQRNLERQRELFGQKFISQAALDQAQNGVDTLKGQMAVDQAALESARVARGYTEIRAPFSGRTGVISVRAGSLVQPGATAAPLVTISQIDLISVSFTLPEKELPGLQRALAAGPVVVTAAPQDASEKPFAGKVSFVDNAVDTATGTIRVKAEFPNPDLKLWPGMYVNVEMAPRTMAGVTVIPAQAVQTGPESRFVYVVGEDQTVAQKPVTLAFVDAGVAVVEGVGAGARVVVEGGQNLRPGAKVTEARPEGAAPEEGGKGKGGKGKGGKGEGGKGEGKKKPGEPQ